MTKRHTAIRKEGNVYHLNRIRIEAELSRFPIHNLSSRRSIDIDITMLDKAGREIRWIISPNARYGHPGELAYRLDTHIRRLIDQGGREIPKILAIGSLRELAEEVNLGGNTNAVKKALLQNALTAVSARLFYTTNNGQEQYFEFADTRYGVVFSGQRLPTGRKADQVYIVFHDLYLTVLQSAKRRPLDYDYLRALPPGAQRLYELCSPKIFVALKYKHQHARYLYSDFCTFSSLTRYYEREQMRKQMYKVLKPHKDSGYIASVVYEEAPDGLGHPDWEILIVPGERASTEYKVFSHVNEAEDEMPQQDLQLIDQPIQVSESQRLREMFYKIGVSPMKAQTLIQEFPERAKLWANVVIAGLLPKSVKDVPAYLVRAIEQNYKPPAAFRKKFSSLVKEESTEVQSSSTQVLRIDPNSLDFQEKCERFGVNPEKFRKRL